MEFVAQGEVALDLCSDKTLSETTRRMFEEGVLMTGGEYCVSAHLRSGASAFSRQASPRYVLVYTGAGGQDLQPLLAAQSQSGIIVQIPHMADLAPGKQYAIRVDTASGFSAHSKPFGIVKYVLSVGGVRPLVFKEERDQKNIDVHVELRDVADRLVTAHDQLGELELSLFYENMELVKEQNILKMVSGSGLHLVNGQAAGRFQIKDVSKNHQKQKFRIGVAVAACHGIGHATTDPILVKSKRSRTPARRPASPPSYRDHSESDNTISGTEPTANIHELLQSLLASNQELIARQQMLERTVEDQRQTIARLQLAIYGGQGEMLAPHVEDSVDESSHEQPFRAKRVRHSMVAQSSMPVSFSYPPVGPPLPPVADSTGMLVFGRQDSFQARILDSKIDFPDIATFPSEEFAATYPQTSRGMFT